MIRAGEQLTCEAGHVLATARREIVSYGDVRAASFDFGEGEPTTFCRTCGLYCVRSFGTERPIGVYPTDDHGNRTGPSLTMRRTLGVRLHMAQRGWVQFDKLGRAA